MNVKEFKIVVLGGGGVGKSALTISLVTGDFLDVYDPTIEDSYRKQALIDGEPALLDILDTAGQEEFSSMQDQWMRDGDGFLLVYSITSRTSFDEIPALLEKISRIKSDSPSDPAVCIAGNKSDLEDQREVMNEEAVALAADKGASFLQTSAKAKINVDEAFYGIVREIRNKRAHHQKATTPQKRRFRCIVL